MHLDALRQNDNGAHYAVRSSAVSEDSAHASFAGEFETVLDVKNDQEVLGIPAEVGKGQFTGMHWLFT